MEDKLPQDSSETVYRLVNDFKERFSEDKIELKTRDLLEKERNESDKKYAIKIIETIVFTLIGLICMAVVGALIKLVILN